MPPTARSIYRRTVRATFAAACALVPTVAGCADLVHFDPPAGSLAREIMAAPGPGGTLDAALILGVPADDETGAPSPGELCRIDAAVAAYRAGEVRAIVFSGSAAHNRFVEAEVMAAEAVRRGVPRERVFLEPRALTTWMNLRLSKRILRAHGLETALVITTADHLPRARRFVEWYGIPARYRACDLATEPGAAGEGLPHRGTSLPSVRPAARSVERSGEMG